MRLIRLVVAVLAAVATLLVTAVPSLASEAPGTKGVWVRGGSAVWQGANTAFGPLHSGRIFYTGQLPASFAGSPGSDLPDDVTLVVSYKTPDTNVASYVCSIPPTRDVVLTYNHEPENQTSPFATGADFVSAFTAQSAKIRAAAASCGLGRVKVAMIALTWSYAVSTRRGYTCSFIPPASTVDYYLGDTYDRNQLSLAREPGFQRWQSCTAGSVPRGLAEHGVGLGNVTASGCQFTDAGRAAVLQADDAYLGANFPDFVLWEYSWVTGSSCSDSWQFPTGGQSAAVWRAIATDASVPPVISVGQPADSATVRGTVTVSGTATSRAALAQVLVSVDGGTPVSASGTTSWSAAVDTTALPSGAHTITVQATDVNGTSGRTSVPVTVDNSRPVTSCPVPPAGSTELSGNLSLETSQSGWTGVYNSNTALARVQPGGGSYDGGWALRVSPKASGTAGVNNANPVWVPGPSGVATAAGRTYTGSALVRADAGRKITLLIRETTSAGAAVGSRSLTLVLGDTNWQQLSAAYTAVANGNVLKYSLYGSSFTSTAQNFLADCLSLQSR